MCSVLLVLSLCIVIFTLISDYNRFCTGIFDLRLDPDHHGFADQKASRQTCTSPSQTSLVPPQAGSTDFVRSALETNPPSATATSFQGFSIPCKDHGGDEHRGNTAMEMLPLQAYLQWEARALCKVWTIMEDDNGSQLCPSSSIHNSEESAMESRTMGRTTSLGAGPMGQIAQTPAVPKAENQERPSGITAQRKRQAEARRRPSAVWSTIAACYAILGTSMDDSLDSRSQHVIRPCLSPNVGDQRGQRQGQADAFIGCRPQEAPRQSARRCSGLNERCLHTCWSAGKPNSSMRQCHNTAEQNGRSQTHRPPG